MFNMFVNIALAAIAVGMLILVHEVGHFLAAKAVGVRVETFSIGFWKKIVWFKKGDTEYRLSLIPLGGYVKLAGELEGEGTGASDEFSSKSPGARALVFVSGVAMNVVFALAAFILAFTIGVPFEVAEVGSVERGSPAWEAGLLPGDRIVKSGSISNPDFEDVQRQVTLLGRDYVTFMVERGGEEYVFDVRPRYDEFMGMRTIGFRPPFEPVVTGLARIDINGRRSPALDAGMQLGDRVLSVNGREVEYFRHIEEELRDRGGEILEMELLRNGEKVALSVETVSARHYVMGISGADTVIEALQGGGPAAEAGLLPGDRIVSVNGVGVRSAVELEESVKAALGEVLLRVERNGTIHGIEIGIPDRRALKDFMFSFTTYANVRLTWVRENGPAWQAGLRAGDVVTHVGERAVGSWADLQLVNARLAGEPRTVRWLRDGENMEAEVIPQISDELRTARIGAVFNKAKMRVRREGIVGAVTTGVGKTYGAFADIVFSIRGFATREVSTQHVGGIVLIAHVAYYSAARGIGQLLYFSAIISAALAFLNILPIPVLDGGHLLFVIIEKLRGRPVGEKARAVSQTIGLSLLLLLVAYAIRNDIMRYID